LSLLTFAYTFVGRTGPFEADDTHRSTSSGPTCPMPTVLDNGQRGTKLERVAVERLLGRMP
jgi:hypothetical protein